MNDRWDAGSTVGAESVGAAAPRPPSDGPVDGGGAAPRYERRETLGAGGMGTVVVARDRVLDRDVALKEVAPRADARVTAAFEARLRREARLTARLEHPGIVPVYDAGRRPDGGMFYTMRVIRGRSLADAAREAPDAAARLRLMRHVLDACLAIGWAHRHGVVHRDIKPANIMVGEFGETQVVDWGLAGTVPGHAAPLVDLASPEGGAPEGRPDDDGGLTAAGTVVGTPHYLSPEQALGRPADARSDVWALGFVIVEVATGRRVRGTPSAEEAIAQACDGLPAIDATGMPVELAAIARRATELAPERRYPDAKALADDLAAWLDGRRVGAHSYSTWELVRRVARAWRVPLAVTTIALVAIVVAVAVGFGETAAERDRAEAEGARARAAAAQARAALTRSEAALGRALASEARSLATRGQGPEAELTAAAALAHAESPEARGILAALDARPRPSRVLTMRLPGCRLFAPTRAGATGLCVDDGGLSLWDLARGEARWRRAMTPPSWVTPMEADGLALYGGEAPTPTAALTLATGATRPDLAMCCTPFTSTPRGDAAVGFSPDRLWVIRDVALPLQTRPLGCTTSGGAAHDPDGGRTFVGCLDGRWSARDGGGVERAGRLEGAAGEHATAVTLVAERDEAIVGTNKGRVLRIALPTSELLASDPGAVGVVSAVALAPDGWTVAVRDELRGVRLWDARAGASLARLPSRHDQGMQWLVGHPRRLLVWSREEAVAWDVPAGRPATLRVGGGVTGLDLDPAGERVAVAAGQAVELVRLDDGDRGVGVDAGVIVKGVSFSPDGDRLAFGLATNERGLGVLRLEDGALDFAGARRFTRRVARFGDGWLRAPDRGPLWLVDADGDGRPLGPDRTFLDLAVTVDGRRAALLAAPGGALIEARAGDASPRDVAADPAWSAVAPANLGDALACASAGGVTLVDGYGDTLAWLDAGRDDTLVELAWSPDDRWLAAGGRSGAVTLWRVADRARVAVVREHRERVAALAFDPRGRWLMSGGWDATLRLTSLAPLEADARALAARLEAGWGVSFEAIARD
ncbi:MAG: protein kinase [Deltaproteobacteria bacterium]|nr:protein kinase [Deltaproteobacteria bacterium]